MKPKEKRKVIAAQKTQGGEFSELLWRQSPFKWIWGGYLYEVAYKESNLDEGWRLNCRAHQGSSNSG